MCFLIAFFICFFFFCFLLVQFISKSYCVLFPAAGAGTFLSPRQPSVSLDFLCLSVFESRLACRCTGKLRWSPRSRAAAASQHWTLSVAALLCSAVGRDDPSGPLAHHLLLQHHLHGQQPQPQQPQQPTGGQRHRGAGQPGHAPNHGGLLLSPTPFPPPTAFLCHKHTHTHTPHSNLCAPPPRPRCSGRICNELCY